MVQDLAVRDATAGAKRLAIWVALGPSGSQILAARVRRSGCERNRLDVIAIGVTDEPAVVIRCIPPLLWFVEHFKAQ